MTAPFDPLGQEAFARQTNVSRETLERLRLHLELLKRWQQRINLVGSATLADPWRRHVLDSAQLFPHLPTPCASLLDLGAGAGFPGLVLAIMGVPNVRLIEADTRKAAFLREAARETGTDVSIEIRRIEQVSAEAVDVVAARALAPLPKLLDLAWKFVGPGTVCLFPKGEAVRSELTAARKSWNMRVNTILSLTNRKGVILRISDISREKPDANR